MERAGVFDDFDISGFEPVMPITTPPPQEKVRKVAEGAAFRSREPEAKPAKRKPRVYRTGRNVQLNVKVRAETLNAFYEIADSQGWVLGETLEKAIEALRLNISST